VQDDVPELLQRLGELRRYVWLYVRERCVMGFVVATSESLVLVHWFRDFADNGYVIVRSRSITEVRYEEPSIRFFEEMMQKEGVISAAEASPIIPLHSLHGALTAIIDQDELVLLDRGLLEPRLAEFHTGRIVAVDEEHVTVRHLAAWGEWESTSRILRTIDVERVELGSPYLRALQKYSSPPYTRLART
jgi:hypothetical protein